MAPLSFGGVVIPATQWIATGVIAAALCTTLIAKVFARRNRQMAADRGQLFVAVFLAALAGIVLLIVDRSLPLAAPLFVAPIPILYLLFYYAFPDPTYMPRWARWLGIILAISFAFSFAPARQSSNSANTAAGVLTHVPLLLGVLATLSNVFSVLAILVGIVPQLYYRYLHFSVTGERPRPAPGTPGIHFWPRLALAVASVAVLVGFVLLSQVVPGHLSAWLLAVTTGLSLIMVLGPIAIAFALLDRRPYDRAALVNRLVICSLLIVCLLAIYAAGILALWYLFPGFSQFAPYAYIPFLILIGLLMASAFQPLWEQLRQRIDQRFYPRLYDARVRATDFALALSGETPPGTLSRRLAEVVQEPLATSWVQLWVPSPALPEPSRTPPGDGDASGASGEIRLRPQIENDADPPDSLEVIAVHSGDPALEALLRPSSVLMVDRQPAGSAIIGELRVAGAYVVLPLVSGGKLVGLLALGPRASTAAGGQYSADEYRLLVMLADTTAPALHRSLVASAEALQAQRRDRVEQELRTARQIQEAMLPKSVPSLRGWSITTSYQPAREVGGDFYDFLPLASGRLGIVLGDVTGKGIPAALVMANTRSMLRAVATQPLVSPGQALAQVNELLCADLPSGMFVTCFYAILDPENGQVRFANAGQDLPYLRQEVGVTSELRATGMPLGLMPGMQYVESDSLMLPGNSLLFYSDGLVEAHSPRREMFGRQRLAALLSSSVASSPIHLLLDELARFTGNGWEQEDDITLVALLREQSAGEETA